MNKLNQKIMMKQDLPFTEAEKVLFKELFGSGSLEQTNQQPVTDRATFKMGDW